MVLRTGVLGSEDGQEVPVRVPEVCGPLVACHVLRFGQENDTAFRKLCVGLANTFDNKDDLRCACDRCPESGVRRAQTECDRACIKKRHLGGPELDW